MDHINSDEDIKVFH